jgi:hypothetical protein
MRRSIFVNSSIAILVVTLFSLAISPTCAQINSQFPSGEQLVVLTNGRILRGRVTRNVEQVIVHMANGSRPVLPADQIDFVCNSLDEAYWGKVARLKATDTTGQVALFNWCLKNKLHDLAQNQIEILLQMGAKATQLENLDRQLNVALMQKQAAQNRLAVGSNKKSIEPDAQVPGQLAAKRDTKSIGLSPIEMNLAIGQSDLIGQNLNQPDVFDASDFRSLPSIDENTLPVENRLPNSQFALTPLIKPEMSGGNFEDGLEEAMSQPIRQVGFEEEVFETVSPDHRMPSAASLSGEIENQTPEDQVDDRIMVSLKQLERELKTLPKGTAGFYRSRVERALTYGCNAAKCHDSESRILPLRQIKATQAITRVQSQRNLRNVLKYVDRAKPFESRLYLAATQPHAGRAEPILILNRAENLKKWLVMIAEDPNQALQDAARLEQSSVTATASGLETQVQDTSPAMKTPLNDSSSVAFENSNRLAPLSDSSLQFPATVGEIPSLSGGEKAFIPKDPFDPEIFNRRFR